MISLFVTLALSNGTLLSFQQITNAALAVRIGSLKSSVINHFIGALFAGLLLLIGCRTGELAFSGVPLLYFMGGCLGVCTVAMGNYAIPRIGAAMVAILFTSSQLLTSSLIDHFGLLGARHISFSLTRGIGICFLILGAALVFVKEKKVCPLTDFMVGKSLLDVREQGGKAPVDS